MENCKISARLHLITNIGSKNRHLLIFKAISSSDEEKVRKKSTAKVQVKNVSGGKKGTTVAPLKAKGITKNKKKKTTSKSSLPTTNEVQEMPMTVIEVENFITSYFVGNAIYARLFKRIKTTPLLIK